MIQFQQVSFKREERMILSDVSFTTNKGEHWIILGKNGSGKTTILEMINGYLFPTSGRIQVLDQVYGQVDLREVRKEIGYISQSLLEKLSLRDPTWEVVTTGLYGYLRLYQRIPEAAKEQAIYLLERLQIGHLAHSPVGLLSQGERKKVLLARALISQPKLMIMDEPCSGLDLYEREKLLEDLTIFNELQVQVIYVTHHIEEIVPLFTHVLLLDDGKVVAAGPKEDVLTANLIQQAYQVQVELDWHHGRPWIRVN